jgi:hypothetical protein
MLISLLLNSIVVMIAALWLIIELLFNKYTIKLNSCQVRKWLKAFETRVIQIRAGAVSLINKRGIGILIMPILNYKKSENCLSASRYS